MAKAPAQEESMPESEPSPDSGQGMSEPPLSEELLTIPEAAARLGIHEKRLRRLLTRTEYKGRTRTQTRTTRTGQRPTSMLPADLLRDVQARLHLESNADNGDVDADKDIQPEVSASTGTRTETRQVVLSAFYERLLLEKDTRLAEMAAALEHEREQSRRLAEALAESQKTIAREQALRSLPAPVAHDTPEKPISPEKSASPDKPETDTKPMSNEAVVAEVSDPVNSAQGEAQTSATGNHGVLETFPFEAPIKAKRDSMGFWEWLWQRIRD